MVELRVLRKSDNSGFSEANSALVDKEYSNKLKVFANRENKKSHFKPKKKKDSSKFVGNCYECGKTGYKGYESQDKGKEKSQLYLVKLFCLRQLTIQTCG